LFFVKKPLKFFGSCFKILIAQQTWIGYTLNNRSLPVLRKAIIGCNGVPVSHIQQFPAESLLIVDQWYARDYEPVLDLRLIWKCYRELGS
jgi:hypothetical protein